MSGQIVDASLVAAPRQRRTQSAVDFELEKPGLPAHAGAAGI
jgi:hypothetical protein